MTLGIMDIPGVGSTLGTTADGTIRGTGILGTIADGTVDGMAAGTAAGTIRGTMAAGDMAALITSTTTTSSVREAEGPTHPAFPRQALPAGAASDPLQGQPVSEVRQQPDPEALPDPQGQEFHLRPQGLRALADAAEEQVRP